MGVASDGADPSPPTVKDPLRNINNRSRNKRTEGARNKALAEGIEIGKQESADKIEEQDQQIKEQKERINRLSKQLALEAAHLLLANQRSDLRATSISTLIADADRQREENTRLEQRVALLTGQLAHKTEEIETVTAAHIFGGLDWESEWFRGDMQASCYPFNMPKR